MSGSGSNATYNQKSDVLTIAEQAKVEMTDEAGKVTLDGTAGTRDARSPAGRALHGLERPRPARRAGHRRREGDGAAVGERGSRHRTSSFAGTRACKGGSGPLESMKASAIDLDYTDDGSSLERALLNGCGEPSDRR